MRTDSIYLTLSEGIHIDKLTDQKRRNMPDLKSFAKYSQLFEPVNSQGESTLSEMTMNCTRLRQLQESVNCMAGCPEAVTTSPRINLIHHVKNKVLSR